MHNFLKACDTVVDEANTKDLATLMNMPPVSLLQRANANYDGAWFNVKHLYALLLHTGDMRPLMTLADQFGFELVAKVAPEPKALTASLINVGKEVADLTIAVHEALDDNHVSPLEKAAIRKELGHVRQSLDVMEQSVKVA